MSRQAIRFEIRCLLASDREMIDGAVGFVSDTHLPVRAVMGRVRMIFRPRANGKIEMVFDEPKRQAKSAE